MPFPSTVHDAISDSSVNDYLEETWLSDYTTFSSGPSIMRQTELVEERTTKQCRFRKIHQTSCSINQLTHSWFRPKNIAIDSITAVSYEPTRELQTDRDRKSIFVKALENLARDLNL